MKQLLPSFLRSFLGNARYAFNEGKPGWIRSKISGLREALSSIFCQGDFRGRSYYPDEPLKGKLRIALEQLYYTVRYYTPISSVSDMYFAYGLDRKSVKARDYVFIAECVECVHQLNSYPYDQLPLLQNKLVANAYLRELDIRVPCNYGVLCRRENHWVVKKAGRLTDFLEWAFAESRHLFCKLLDGECGRGAFALDTEREGHRLVVDGIRVSWEDFQRELDGELILEERILQHPALKELHPQSLNTIRIVTVKTGVSERPVIIHRVLRVGTGSSTVDNWHHAGLGIGIDPSGHLLPYGYPRPLSKPRGEGRLTKHPDTGIEFAGREIPFFREVEAMAMQAHEAFPYCTSVGWDIAVSEDGPVLIEGNTDWDIEFGQVPLGGMRPLIEKYILPVRQRMRAQRLYVLLRQRVHVK